MSSINPAYAKPGVASQIINAFEDNADLPNIKLGQILSAESYDKLRLTVDRATKKEIVAPLEYHYSTTTLKIPQLTKAIAAFVNPIFRTKLNSEVWKLVSITWKDYSMLLDTQTTRKGYDIIIDISDDFPENAGADIVYAKNKETVEIPASQNTLIVVKIDENTRSFLKYANHYAKDKRRNFLVQHI